MPRTSSWRLVEACPLDALQRAEARPPARPDRSSRAGVAATLPALLLSGRAAARAARRRRRRARRTSRRSAPRSSPVAWRPRQERDVAGPPAGPRLRRRRVPLDLLLDGLAARFTEGPSPAAAAAAGARRVRARRWPRRTRSRWFWLAWRVGAELWDDETWHELATRQVQVVARAGRSVLPLAALTGPSCIARRRFRRGGGADRAGRCDRGGRRQSPRCSPCCSWPGGGTRPRHASRCRIRDAAAEAGQGRSRCAGYTTAVLYNGLGRYEDALLAARQACEHDDLGLFGLALDRARRGGASAAGAQSWLRPRSARSRSERAPPARTGRCGVQARHVRC